MEIEDLFRCTEKLVWWTANYYKGDGSLFDERMCTNHPIAYLYTLACAQGGSRQDLYVEGAPAILEQSLLLGVFKSAFVNFRMLHYSEVITYLRVLSILHISICLPTHYIVGKCRVLAEDGFG